ncbi:nucleotidyltransferase family protein [Shewanella cyperi]|uniref:Nucleotidyltransferase family protein n=1 Tax=Shewanella cyperi TaxID=2814292 RepID=A0A974XK72_9GAMM|nr:nucleotidyltransferase family protein [Shewanella cyperi]QSX29920.1 nucleotidyltransferase family protein [Shewanella cyperi]
MKLLPVLLAAGASSRFQGAKLAASLPNGRTLLQQSFATLKELKGSCGTQLLPVHVCLGGHYQRLRPLLPRDTPVIASADWQLGLGHSIATVARFAATQQVDALLLTLADQVLISTRDLEQLLATWQESGHTSAAWYLQQTGAPAIFNRAEFAALANLNGDRGAKALLSQLQGQKKLAWLALDSAATDIDTRADLRRLSEQGEINVTTQD